MKKKRAFTLLEIMVVIVLIGVISSVVGYSMKGSLEKGKAFKTERAKEQLEDLLNLQLAQGIPEDQLMQAPEKFLRLAGHSQPNNIIKDGWGERFDIRMARGEIKATSRKWNNYKEREKRQLDATDQDDSNDERSE